MIGPDDEVWNAVSGIGNIKSPGPDGFGILFFKHCWSVVKVDFIAAIPEFFSRGRLLRQNNATFIALVPKVDRPFLVKEFRPIACCNSVMKVISKIMVGRLRPLLESLVSSNQGAFVHNRRISDNIAVSLDLVRGYDSRSISPRCLLQIDL